MEIRSVVIDDAKLLFDWANDLDTRSNSFNTEMIAWETHLSWLQKKLKEANRSFYLFIQDNEPVGVVRFETSNEIVIGITVAPMHRGKGLGSLMIRMACARFHKKNNADIHAYIKKRNIQSQKSFEKAGFVFLRNDTYNGEDCLILIEKKHVND
jgi:RimJ/RimL family protein N-acetyltransferase